MFRIRVPEQDQHTPGGWVCIDGGVWGLVSSPTQATTFASKSDLLDMVDTFGPLRVRLTGKIEEVPCQG